MVSSLAWLQLKHEPLRLLVALGGIVFAVILIFMQLGFNTALFQSNVRVHSHLVADIVLISPRSLSLLMSRSFPRRRIYQALGFDGVASVAALYSGRSIWKDPQTGIARDVFVVGFDPADEVIDLPGITANLAKIRIPDWYLFDRNARPEFAAVTEEFERGETVLREVAGRRIRVAGLFDLGTSFGIDALLVSSDLNFRRLFPDRPAGMIEVGAVRLKPGADAHAVRQGLAARLPNDVLVLTKDEFVEHELAYWRETTPIGYVLGFGSIMGLVIGAVIVYQILFTDIAGHLPEYATLKAMGYTNARLFTMVILQVIMLAGLGYLPGLLASAYLYQVSENATHLPMRITLETSALVLALTVLMCVVAGAIALRKVRSADPAEIF